MKYAVYTNNNLIVDMTEFIHESMELDFVNPDVVFSFGGDGTMLGAIHKYEKILDKVKFLGIKAGTLGFFTNFEKDSIKKTIDMLVEKKLAENKFSLLEFTINDKIKGLAINEIAITNPIHTQIIDVYINDNLFETFRGTGFLVSPPSGSTAYNKSLGGSVIDPSLKAYQLTEIASINNRIYKTLASPIIFSESVKTTLIPKTSQNIYISVDGVELVVDDVKKIVCELSKKEVNILSHKDDDFFKRVKEAFI